MGTLTSRIGSAIAATSGAVLLGACASYTPKNYLSHHMIPVTADGELDQFGFKDPLLPSQGRPPRGRNVDEHIKVVLDAAVADARSRGVSPGDPVKLLIHIHGGRKPASASVKTSDQILVAMQGDAKVPAVDRLYPIFIRWPSWDIGAAMKRVTTLRQGRRVGATISILTTPFVVAQDVVSGVIKWPQSFLYQLFRDSAVATQVATGRRVLPTWDDAHRIAEALEAREGPGNKTLFEGDYERSNWNHAFRLAAYFPSQLVKIPMQALILEGLGQDAWDEMRRRAHSLVWVPETFENEREGVGATKIVKQAKEAGANGVLPKLYRAIQDHDEDFKLFLVAHSMGAISMNEGMPTLLSIIEEAPDEIHVERILYMAPACSVGDAAESLVPLLEKSPDTHFYLMTLHPVAEADEINALEAVPRGSLLEWIDHYYTNPATHTERVFGKWSNAVPALNLFADVISQVHFKAFTVEPGSIPVAHGQFHSIPFWRKGAYTVPGVANYPAGWLEDTCESCAPSSSTYLPW